MSVWKNLLRAEVSRQAYKLKMLSAFSGVWQGEQV
jgi:hypothetical protein